MDAQTPDQMVKQTMGQYGIERETAIMLATKTFEAALRLEGEPTEKAIDRKIAELFVKEADRRTPWFVNLMEAHYRKNLPKWTKLNDEALELGQDPATRISVTENVLMEVAGERVKLVQLAKQGSTIEEITEVAFTFDDERSTEERYALIAKQMA